MNLFDGTLIPLYNRFAHHSRYVDDLFGHIAGDDLMKGGVILAAFWGLWFMRRPLPDQAVARTTLLVTLIAAFLAVGSARALTLVLPFRARPLFAGAPFTQQPYDVQGILNALPNWSSFPSDHAALFFALAAGCFLVARRVGVALIVYASVFIMWPRLYLGIHYPTDILVGGLIGVVCVLGATIAVRQLPPLGRRLDWSGVCAGRDDRRAATAPAIATGSAHACANRPVSVHLLCHPLRDVFRDRLAL